MLISEQYYNFCTEKNNVFLSPLKEWLENKLTYQRDYEKLISERNYRIL